MLRETGWYRIKVTKDSPNPILSFWSEEVGYWTTPTGSYRDNDIFQVYSGMVMTEDGHLLSIHNEHVTVQRDHVTAIDWNTASDFGLIFRINKEILHPLGLALCREVKTGTSPMLVVSEDGEWHYSDEIVERNSSLCPPDNWKDSIQKLKNIVYIRNNV